MALLWVDGFDNYGNTVDAAAVPTGILGRNYVMFQESYARIKTGRTGNLYALNCGGYGAWLRKLGLPTTNSTFIIGLGVYIQGPDINGGIPLISLADGSTVGVELWTDTSGHLIIHAGSTTVATTTFAMSINTWYYLELKITCTTAANYSYELRCGQTTIASGTDTHKPGTHAYHDGFKIWGYNYHYGLWIDDLYVADGSGSYNNDFLGNTYIQLLYPDGDVTTQWTPSTAGSHFSLVNEAISDDTSYIEDTVSGHVDLYDFQSCLSIGGIKAVVVSVEARDTDAASYNLKIRCVSGGTTVDGATQFGGSSNYTTKTNIYETDPNTGLPWTDTNFNAARFGVVIP